MPELEEAGNTPLEAQEVEETVEAGSDAPPPEKPEPANVPYRVFAEANARANDAQRQMVEMQNAILRIQQQQYEAQRPRLPEPEIDPVVEELIMPVVGKHLAPVQRELQEVKHREAVLIAERQAKAAWDYVRDNVPDLDELSGDFQEYLGSLPKARQDKITSDPDLVIQTAELVRARRAAGMSVSQKAAKQDLKARSKGDSGSASVPSKPSSNINWSTLSDEEFAAHEKKLGIRNR